MTAETVNQRKMRQAIVDAFNESELQTLCFDLQIDYEALPPGSKVDKARELVALCVRDKRIDELISLCEAMRPRVAWSSMVATAISDTSPPFMGLKYFDADHADLFFGRETLTAELTTHLQANNFLAVVGASGSGKSSLVRAGLVPALQDALPNLKIHVFTPTDHPLEALATTLTRHTDSIGETAKFIDAMASDPRSLHLAARRLLHEDEQLLLVIDQFEELFTLCRSEEKRQAFVDNLVTAVTNPDGDPSNRPTRAVVALRADFYHHCAQYDTLRRLLETQQRYIGAMNPTELRRAIEMPAKQNGFSFEDGLVELLLRDVGASGDQPPEPGALPLLSHALLETWRRREGNTLTFSGYTDAGGVQGAIAKTAESVFTQKLTPAQQTIARNIFLRLTELGEGTQDTRRRALISELLPASDAADETQDVLQILAQARLITTDETFAEVAHEALIREWPTLRFWLSHNREGLRLHRHLTEAAYEWREMDFDPDELYRGARLEQATEWGSQQDEELNDLERDFLAASIAAKQQVLEEKEAQQKRELEQAQKLAQEQQQRAEAEAQVARRARNFNYALVVILLLVVAGAIGLINAAQLREAAAQAESDAAAAEIAARETAVAADALALESTTAALEAATVQALATSDNALATAEVAANQTLVAERAEIENQQEATAQVATVIAQATRLMQETADTQLTSYVRKQDNMPMLFITAGSYPMGIANGDNNPLHIVTINSFYLDQYEVSVQQYADFLNRREGNRQACNGVECAVTLENTTFTNLVSNLGVFEARPGTDRYPATWITWEGATAYCAAVDARLPTEAEWEYAARGVDGRNYPWGNTEPVVNDTAVFGYTSLQSNSFGRAFVRVDALPNGASPFGIFGMAGGAAEWVQDWYDPDFYSQPFPEIGYNDDESSGLKVLRGGSWVDTADEITTTTRRTLSPTDSNISDLDNSHWGAGFRCARDADQ